MVVGIVVGAVGVTVIVVVEMIEVGEIVEIILGNDVGIATEIRVVEVDIGIGMVIMIVIGSVIEVVVCARVDGRVSRKGFTKLPLI